MVFLVSGLLGSYFTRDLIKPENREVKELLRFFSSPMLCIGPRIKKH